MLFNIKVWLPVGGEVGFESLLVDSLRRRMVEEKSTPGEMSRQIAGIICVRSFTYRL